MGKGALELQPWGHPRSLGHFITAPLTALVWGHGTGTGTVPVTKKQSWTGARAEPGAIAAWEV